MSGCATGSGTTRRKATLCGRGRAAGLVLATVWVAGSAAACRSAGGPGSGAGADPGWSGPPRPARDPARSYFGLNGTKAFHIPDELDTTVPRRAAWMGELGVTWDRCDLWWHVVEPERGRFDFDRAERVYAALERAGLRWYPILCYGAAWYPTGRTAPLEDRDYEDFARYVEETVRRFRGRITQWSVWNEPNIHEFWSPEPSVADYVRLLKVASAAIKRADPAARVCAPAVAPLGAWDRQFVEGLYRLGARDAFDIFDYHYYRNDPPEHEVPREIAEIRAVMARYGDAAKPIHISESGVTSIVDGRTGPDERQAALVVRNQLLSLAAGVERIYWFDLQNWADDRPAEWGTQLGLVTAAGRKKRAFDAYRTLVQQVDYQPILGRVPGLGENVWGVLFYDADADEYVLTAWTADLGRRATLDVRAAGSALRVVGPYGDVTTLRAVAGAGARADGRSAAVSLDRHPRYIRGVDRAYALRAGVRFSAALTLLAPGESAPLTIVKHPLLADCRVEVQRVVCSPGLAWDAEHGRLTLAPLEAAPAGNPTVTATVCVRPAAAADEGAVTLYLHSEVEVLPTLTLTVGRRVEGEALHLAARLTSETERPAAGELRVVGGPAGGGEVLAGQRIEVLAARETRTVELAVPLERLRRVATLEEWFVEFGPARQRIGVVPLAWSDARGPKLGGAADAAGAGWHAPPLRIDRAEQLFHRAGAWSPEDASAEVRLQVGPDALYVRADVRDQDPLVNPHPAREMWRGDGLEVFLGVCGPTARTVIRRDCEIHLGLAPVHNTDGPPVAFWFGPDRVLTGARLAARRTDDGYVLEAAIPLAEIGLTAHQVRPGTVLGLDVTLNDVDRNEFVPAGVAPGRRAAWTGGAANWIDPSRYGIGVVRQVPSRETDVPAAAPLR